MRMTGEKISKVGGRVDAKWTGCLYQFRGQRESRWGGKGARGLMRAALGWCSGCR